MKHLIFFIFILSLKSNAQVIAPSAEEVVFQYQTEFVTSDLQTEALPLAQYHASHMFGIFHSPSLVARFSINPHYLEGIGVPRSDNQIQVLSRKKVSNDKVLIQYRNKGRLLLQKKVAANLLQKGELVIPLPYQLDEIYNEKCTDAHYTTLGDYWYFYDPYRKGCEYLSKEPYAKLTKAVIKASPVRKMEQSPRLDLLRGANDNGNDFLVYVIHGFEESATNKRDEGRKNFKEFETYMQQRGFERKIISQSQRNPQALHTKQIQLKSGYVMNVKVYHLLVETSIDSRSTVFAKFFKQAVAVADVIVYGGHSGLGANLDIPSLEQKAGAFEFNPKKRQIFFFDSCASYSYYLQSFAAEKTRAKIDIISYGLSSLFQTSQSVLANFMDILFNTQIEVVKWIDILNLMEKPLNGSTYLLNVGGV